VNTFVTLSIFHFGFSESRLLDSPWNPSNAPTSLVPERDGDSQVITELMILDSKS
jgi:hypothetical protein